MHLRAEKSSMQHWCFTRHNISIPRLCCVRPQTCIPPVQLLIHMNNFTSTTYTTHSASTRPSMPTDTYCSYTDIKTIYNAGLALAPNCALNCSAVVPGWERSYATLAYSLKRQRLGEWEVLPRSPFHEHASRSPCRPPAAPQRRRAPTARRASRRLC